LLKDIQNHIKQANSVEKLIYINVAIFILTVLFSKFIIKWFALPATFTDFMTRPWSLLTYSFLHERLFHILSNLLVLFYIGNLFLNFFSKKKLIIYYVSGAIFGGVVFMLYFFLQKTTSGSLIGASAAVTAILVGLAVKIPHYSLRLRFIGSVELWVLAAIWVGLSVLATAGVNAGGGVAHLGGAIIGYLLTAYFNEGIIFEKMFVPKKKSKPFKKVYKNKATPKSRVSYSEKKQNQRKIDAILDKISKSGYEALSKAEKEFLFSQKE